MITEIGVRPTMKEKYGADGRPRDVLDYETDESTRSSVLDADAMLGMVDNEALAPVAARTYLGLDRAPARV